MTSRIRIRGGTLVTLDDQRRIMQGDLLIEDSRIVAVAATAGAVPGQPSLTSALGSPGDSETLVEAAGCAVLPGLVQTHVHLCQTLFRGQGDDLELLTWLKQRIWPLEAAHDPYSLDASARLGLAELILGGTTCIVDMATVHHTEWVFRAIEASGLRAIGGKCMMDHGDDVPAGLREAADAALQESIDLLERWDGAAEGRIHYAFAPRFAVSCSDGLLREVAREAAARQIMVHTHASENLGECALVEAERGCRNLAYFDRLGLTGPNLLLAHCVHLDEMEMQILASSGTRVAHCPSSNLKLASGMARVEEMRRRGVAVGLGADGAPCNNNLDGWREMRLASLLQKALVGPTALPAAAALEMATLGGARAIGLEQEIGSLEVGKRADVIVVNISGLHSEPADEADWAASVVSRLVYTATAADVRATIVDGRLLMQDRRLLGLDEAAIAASSRQALREVKQRAGI